MKLEIKKEIFELFPELTIAVVVAKDIDNTKADDSVTKDIREQENKLRDTYSKDKLNEVENISVWRKAYSSFGAKPKKYKASVEALMRRVLEGENLPSINKIVDLYNLMSIKNIMPLGGDDLDKIEGDICLKKSTGKERFIQINGSEEDNPKEGEVIYADDKDTLCRRWNWRECDKSKLTEDTKNVILYAESLVGRKLAEDVLKQLLNLIKDKFDVEAEGFILDQKNAILDIDKLKLVKTDYKIVKSDPGSEDKGDKSSKKEGKKSEKSKKERKQEADVKHWADQVAERVIHQKGDRKNYVVASGISPSGHIHIGNFREIITTELVATALESKGKKVRFIYSWDDYDRLRKLPAEVDKAFEQHIGKPYSEIPCPFGCHESYALHFEKELEDSISGLGIDVEFIRQSIPYKACKYAEEIKKALVAREKIKEILDRYRKEPLSDDYIPLTVYCEKCGKDDTSVVFYDEEYTVEYTCECGHKDTIDFRKKGIVKLPWRVDWPMRWNFEKVDFEPGGKDHSSPGSSRTTGVEIQKEVYGTEAPIYQMYDFIRVKGGAGKMSGSAGGAYTVNDVLEVYEPEMVRWLFAGTRPVTEFAISFDLDAIKNYEDFDRMERIYYGKEDVNEKNKAKQSRIYELSVIEKPGKKLPYQPSFRHLTNILQIYDEDIDKAAEHYDFKTKADEERFKVRSRCALNWLKEYAPDDMKFRIQTAVPDHLKLGAKEKKALKGVAEILDDMKDDAELHNKFYEICEESGIEVKDFFKAAYTVLINKEKGPKLANFIFTIGKRQVRNLFENL